MFLRKLRDAPLQLGVGKRSSVATRETGYAANTSAHRHAAFVVGLENSIKPAAGPLSVGHAIACSGDWLFLLVPRATRMLR